MLKVYFIIKISYQNIHTFNKLLLKIITIKPDRPHSAYQTTRCSTKGPNPK